jgi:hypothetical protein
MSTSSPEVPAEGYTVPAEALPAARTPGSIRKRNWLATFALLATFLCGALPGFLLGVVALAQIYSREEQQGKGEAWAAVIASSVIMLGVAAYALATP